MSELVKYEVCKSCLSIGIRYNDCICTYMDGYETIELEFEVCECCGHVDDSYPADTEFNKSQLET